MKRVIFAWLLGLFLAAALAAPAQSQRIEVVADCTVGKSPAHTAGAAANVLYIDTAGRLCSQSFTVFNGATLDQQFTCPSSAVVNVTAAATTEIVALTAGQIIRVCSIAVSMSIAGTATFVYGTGTNCGTGTTSLTGAMPLALGTPLALSGQNGSLFRTAIANALCVTAVTGNVVGFVTYAKF